MSKVRDRYEKLVDDIPEDSTMGEAIRNYVTELESDKAELIKVINMLITKSTKGGWIETILSPILKKHGVEI
jgi:hypothetical protein